MYKLLFDNTPGSRLIIENNIIVDCNKEAAVDLGYENGHEVAGQTFEQISLSGELPTLPELERSSDNMYNWKFKTKSNETINTKAQLTFAAENGHNYYCIQWYHEDEWDKLEEANIFQGAILRAVIDAETNLIYAKNYCNGDGKYIGCNRAFREFYGLEEDDIVGHNDLEIFGEKQGSEFRARDQQVIESQSNQKCDEWVISADGSKVLLQTHKTILKDHNDHIIGLLSISRDITKERKHIEELEKSEKAYKEMANTDELTGIPNRRLFFDLSKKIFEEAAIKKQPLSLIMIDLDDFKAINDTYGHIAGDKALKHTVKCFQKSIRKDDLLARYAGDEFVILLPNTTTDEAVKVAKKLRNNIVKEPLATEDGIKIPITISLGINTHLDEDVCEELLMNADKALYHAKELGRNHIEVYKRPKV